jgi:DNA-binding XRE family transcriptional regulator
MMYKIKTDKDNIKELIELACKIGRVNKTELLSTSRKGKVREVRACVAVVLRMAFDLTQVETGEVLGRDHSTIQFYEREHARMMSLNYYKDIYNELIIFAKDAGHEPIAHGVKSNAIILTLKQELSALKFKNKELSKQLKQFEKFKELFAS